MKKLTKELSNYTVFGVLTTLISILTYRMFLFINIHYIFSTTLSSTIAVIFAYVTNRKYVFKSNNHVVAESIKFFTARIVVFILETLVLIVAVSYFKFDEFYSKIVVIVLVIILNYILSKFIVFRESKRRVYFEKD